MTITSPLYLNRVTTETTDLLGNGQVTLTTLTLSVEQLQQGLIKELGYRNFSVLIAIASFANSDNQSFPTLEKLVEVTGISKPTLVTAIKALEKVEINGEKIFSKSKVLTNTGHAKSIYHFMQEYTGTTVVSNKPVDYINKFCAVFEEVFGRAYVPNYGRDTKIIKDKLIANFSEEDIPLIIETTVRNYEKWNRNPSYPTPTIVALSWLANRAADEIQKDKKMEKELADRIEVAEQVELFDPLAQLDL